MANNLDARSIGGNNHNTLLAVCVGVVRVTLAEDKVDLCPGIACTADVPEGELLKSGNPVVFADERTTCDH